MMVPNFTETMTVIVKGSQKSKGHMNELEQRVSGDVNEMHLSFSDDGRGSSLDSLSFVGTQKSKTTPMAMQWLRDFVSFTLTTSSNSLTVH